MGDIFSAILERVGHGVRVGVRCARLGQQTLPDEVASTFGLVPLGEGWIRLSRQSALNVLRTLLHKDMAYDDERMSIHEANELADQFLKLFPDDAIFHTNGSWEEGAKSNITGTGTVGPSWNPATQATFDGGIVVISDRKIGVLWIEDED